MCLNFIAKVLSETQSFVCWSAEELDVALLKYSGVYNAELDDVDDEEDSATDPGSERSPQSNEEETGLEEDLPELGGDVELGDLESEEH